MARKAGDAPPVSGSVSSGGGPSSVGGVRSEVIEVKNAHVSNRPSRARSVAPLTRVLPREPITSAATIRGEAPRRTTLIPRKRPLTSPRSLLPAPVSDMRIGPQRCLGETSS